MAILKTTNLDRKGGRTYNIPNKGVQGMEPMNMTETARLILDLRAKGWSDTEIINHILYIVTGDQSYKTEEKK